jgi:hypothetical protein
MNALALRLLRFLEKCFPFWNQPGATTLVIATAIHLVQAVVLPLTDTANRLTPIAALLKNLPMLPALPVEKSVVIWLFAVAIMAIVSMYGTRLSHWVSAPVLIPQQTLLAITCAGAIAETWNGTYTDGYPAPHAFIRKGQE